MPFVPSPAEVAVVNAIFTQADPQKLGLVTGEQGVRVFAGAHLPPATLGDIWSLADPENNGALTRKGVAVAVRLIGWAQAGELPTAELIDKAGPLPTIDGLQVPAVSSLPARAPAPISTLPSALPPLLPTDRTKFLTLFNKANPGGGLLNGEQAKNIFVRSKLSVERLNAIWSLVDTTNRGALDATQFILAMYFIQGSMSTPQTIPVLPPSIPPFLWDQAGGRPPSVQSHSTGGSLPSPSLHSTMAPKAFMPQYTGLQAQMTGSTIPLAPQMTGSRMPPSIPSRPSNLSIAPQMTGQLASPFPLARPPPSATLPWDVTAEDKLRSDGFFDNLDTEHLGYVEGAAAVPFMLLSNLPEDVLARVWDLADMKNDGRLTKDTFAVAMHLINKVLEGKELPEFLPPTLIPPSMRLSASQFQAASSMPVLSETHRDLLSLDDDVAVQAPVQTPPQKVASPPPVPVISQISASALNPNVQTPPVPAPSSTIRPSVRRDLLDDEEAEERQQKQLAQNSVEIANVRNQLASTAAAQASAEDERAKLESDLATSAATLSQLQTQLASAKVGFDTETKLLAGLRERYQTQAKEIQTTREQLITAESDLSAVKLEKAEIGGNLLREKDDVRELKRRLAEVIEETAAIKKEIEQAKKDARMQKGLLAIAKKQLQTAEAEKEAASNELAEAREEATKAEEEVAQAESELAYLKSPETKPAALANGAPAGVSTSPAPVEPSSRAISPPIPAASPALPFADVSGVASPALSSKSNNPFDRLRKGSVASDTSIPQRTASPFAPQALVAEAKSVDEDDPFGFNEMDSHAADATPTKPPVTETAKQTSLGFDALFEDNVASPTSTVPETAASPSETFFTPPGTSAAETTRYQPMESLFVEKEDSSTSRFPALSDVPAARKGTADELPPMEMEKDADDSSSDEDEKPLGQVKEDIKAAAAASTSQLAAAPRTDTSFADAFGFPAVDASAPTTGPSSHFSTIGSDKVLSSPSVSTEPIQPTVNGHATGISAASAFDEAMGVLPTQPQQPTAAATAEQSFKFDNFDDTFDFGDSSFTHARNKSNEITMPMPNTSVPPSAAFDEAFGLSPAAAPVGGNTAPAPAVAATPLSFDDAFDVETTEPTAAPSFPQPAPTMPIAASAPAVAPESPTTTTHTHNTAQTSNGVGQNGSSIRSESPTAVRGSSSSARATSPPPRTSSPKIPAARPRPAKESASARPGSTLTPDSAGPSRSSRLSIHFPFGRSKSSKEKKDKEKKDKHAKEHQGREEHGGVMPPPVPSIPTGYSMERLETGELGTVAEDGDVPALKQLMEYGFNREQAIEALEATGYSFQRALNKLLSTP